MKYLILIFFALFCNSCSKKETTITTNNTVKSPFTLKYEIISSSDIYVPTGGVGADINIVNGTGQSEIKIDFISGKTWSYTVNVTSTQRPIICRLINTSTLWTKSTGTITGNIYINGTLKATATNPISSLGANYNYAVISLQTFIY